MPVIHLLVQLTHNSHIAVSLALCYQIIQLINLMTNLMGSSESAQTTPRWPPPGALRAGTEGSFLGAEMEFLMSSWTSRRG